MKRPLLFILLIALILRLAYVLSLDPGAPYVIEGGDMRFYLIHGYALVSGQPVPGVELRLLAQPPVYFIINGIPQVIFSPEGAVIAIRITQAIMGTLTTYFAYRLARRIGGERAGWIAAGFVAINPIFILECGQILTETTYIFFVSAALAIYVDSLTPQPFLPRERGSRAQRDGGEASPSPSGEGEKAALSSSPLSPRRGDLGVRFAFVGALFGLATLTRAVLLLFPVGLAIHLLMVYRGRAWGKIAMLLIAYALIVSTWTVYNLARWNRFVIAGEGLPAFLYIGAAGWDDPQVVDQQLNQALGEEASNDAGERQGDYLEAAGSQIGGDVGGYARRRIGELVGAYFQPHGTILFAGESLRDLAANWLSEDRSLAGIGRILGGEQFFPKLLLYVFHYVALIIGVIGAWRTRKQWRLTLPLLGFIAYATLVHFFLLALPRYIFPTMLCWIVLASSQFTANSRPIEREPANEMAVQG